MNERLTTQQQDILNFIEWSLDEHGWPPSVREIMDFFSFASTNGITDRLLALEYKGWINRGKGAREISIVGRVNDIKQLRARVAELEAENAAFREEALA